MKAVWKLSPLQAKWVKTNKKNNGPFESHINKVDFGHEQIFGVRRSLG